MRLATVLTALALLVAGCGGGGGGSSSTATGGAASAANTTSSGGAGTSAAQYKTVVQQLMQQVQKVALDQPKSGAGPDAQAAYAQGLQSAVQQAHDQLAKLHPPGKFAQANQVIVTTFARYADLLGQLATAARKQDKAAVGRISSQVKTETAHLQGALAQLTGGG
jgi:hypothetical protein